MFWIDLSFPTPAEFWVPEDRQFIIYPTKELPTYVKQKDLFRITVNENKENRMIKNLHVRKPNKNGEVETKCILKEGDF
jgi:hypothetical protein